MIAITELVATSSALSKAIRDYNDPNDEITSDHTKCFRDIAPRGWTTLTVSLCF
ncbi:hypothetical protein WHZ77_21090 [Bradyrhizobium sp. A5]|uniref:hypothetical protein n=1 Tax=Bradyrhizobium sp. A5 TaxID=3133696 RepID=UPI00324DD47D